MVATAAQLTETNPVIANMELQFQAQKAAYKLRPMPTAEERIDLIERLKPALIKHQDNFVEAAHKDFGSRCPTETRFVEIASLLETVKYCSKNVARWMEPQKRSVALSLKPAKARVYYQPLGVVGVMVPWNYPIFLALDPMIAALAAGNRVMIKMSEFTPHCAEALRVMLAEIYPQDQVTVVIGETDVGIAFSRLAFDHLLFTGSTAVGKQVMAAAAENLTPVTLELGGKSPVVIHETFPLEIAAERISWGKCINAGQTCVAPDYALIHESKVDQFASAFYGVVSQWYPTKRNNEDFTAVINERQMARLKGYLSDAKAKGARVVEINPARENFDGSGKMPITLVFDTTDDMLIEQNEIFGPLLIIKSYQSIEDAIQYINDRPRPLALYYFDFDKERADYLLNHTHSGGACINDTLNHVAVEDMPFGGVGPSGMGHYHGHEGFLTFSKAKGVMIKGKVSATKMLFPPWNRKIHRFLLNVAMKNPEK